MRDILCLTSIILICGMEDEEKFFYQSELDFFGENSPLYGGSHFDAIPQFLSHSSSGKEDKGGEKPPQIKAYNPIDQLKSIPQGRQPEFMNYFSNHKTLNGIRHFFSFEEENQHRGEFLQNIELDAMNDNKASFELDRLFIGGENRDTHREVIQGMVQTLTKRIEDINGRTMNSVNISKTISNAFHEHFENFTLVLNSSTFLEEFQENFKNMVNHCKKFKGPGIELVITLYEFWSKSFKDMINEIWRHSSKFTLNFFKKNEPQQVDSSNHSMNSEIRSESSRTVGSKDKRKGWTKEENEYLLKYIDSNMIFSQSVIKNIATQFNRSVSSVSSKIQKLMKCRKGEQTQEDSLLQKAVQILKMYEEGLNRQTLLEKLNEHYEMGYGGQWQKSVGQLLSSKKEFIRIRGKHKLINPHLFHQLQNSDENRANLTFKDKVIKVLLNLPNCEGDLKTLIDQYLILFGEIDCAGQHINEERRKTIQSNISKTLSRYDIFDNSKAKTKYILNPLYKSSNTNQMQVEGFLAL